MVREVKLAFTTVKTILNILNVLLQHAYHLENGLRVKEKDKQSSELLKNHGKLGNEEGL